MGLRPTWRLLGGPGSPGGNRSFLSVPLFFSCGAPCYLHGFLQEA